MPITTRERSALPFHWVDLAPGGAIEVANRGYLYGETLFETLRFQGDQFQLLDRHLARMERGCAVLGLVFPGERLEEQLALARTYLRDREIDCACLRLSLSRREQGRGYTAPEGGQALIVCALSPLDLDWRSVPEPVHAITCKLNTALQPALAGIKHGNRLEQILAAGEVRRAGVGEGVVCTLDGRVSATVSGNLFAWDGQSWLTPPAGECGIEGTVRDFLLEVAATANEFSVREQSLSAQDLHRMQALCSTNSLTGPRQIETLDETRFEDGKAAASLQRAWFDAVEQSS